MSTITDPTAATMDHSKEIHEISESRPDSMLENVSTAQSGMTDDQENNYPEGGLRANLVVVGSLCCMSGCFGLVNSIGVFNAYIAENQLRDYESSTISWIFSLYLFLIFFCGVQIGPIFDAFGPRMLVLVGTALLILGVMVLGVCTEFWHFILAFSISAGLGSSMLFTPSVAAISHFFNKRRGTATGIAATGGSLGGVIFPLMLQRLFPEVGWGWATRILGFILLFLCAVGFLLIGDRVKELREAAQRSAERKQAIAATKRTSDDEPEKDLAPPTPSWKEILPNPRIFMDGTGALALTTAGIFFLEWGLFPPITYVTTFALRAGVSNSLSYQLVAVLNAGSCFGRFLPGFVADKWGRFNTMILTLTFCFICIVVFWLPATILSIGNDPGTADTTTILGLYVPFCLLFGFASGSGISLTPVCVGQLCRTQEYGRYYASCYTIVSFGTLTGIPIAGALLRACDNEYTGVVAFCAASYVAATLCFLTVKGIKRGWSPRIVW